VFVFLNFLGVSTAVLKNPDPHHFPGSGIDSTKDDLVG
jgi:hypothetical protein